MAVAAVVVVVGALAVADVVVEFVVEVVAAVVDQWVAVAGVVVDSEAYPV